MSDPIPGISNQAMLDQFEACGRVLPAPAYGAVKQKIVDLLALGTDEGTQQAHHTRREMLVGAFLASKSLQVEYDRKYGKQTPDWTILNGSNPVAIVEVFTLNVDQKTGAILASTAGQGPAVVWMSDPDRRIESPVKLKVDRYRDLAIEHGVALIAAICPSLEAGITDEVPGAIAAIFSQEPALSGVLHMEHLGWGYRFSYTPNPSASIKYTLPETVWAKAHP